MSKDEKTILQMVIDGILFVDMNGIIWRRKKKHKEWNGYRQCKPSKLGCLTHNGYVQICIRDPKGKTIRAFAHRIVWLLNNGNIPNELQINHKNGIKEDNHLMNLELATASEQTIHAVNVLGRKVGNHTRGKNRLGIHFKLSEDNVKQILCMLADGLTAKEVAEQFPVTSTRINQLRRVK